MTAQQISISPVFGKKLRIAYRHFPLVFGKKLRVAHGYFPTLKGKKLRMAYEHFPPVFENSSKGPMDIFLLFLQIPQIGLWTFSSHF